MSEIEKLPNGWVLTTIPALISGGVFTDGDWVESKDQDPQGSVRLLQLADIGDGFFINKSNRFLNEETANYLNCTYLKPNDVLVARMPEPLGRACLMPKTKQASVTVVDVCVIRPAKVEHFSTSWLMHFINSPEFRGKIAALQSGSTRKRISRGNLSKIELPLPPRDEQDRIVDKLEELFSELDAGVKELKAAQIKLSQYRQSLLKTAVDGSLTEQWRAENSAQVQETGEQLLARILKQRREQWQQQKLAEFAKKGKTPPKNWQDAYPEPVQPDTTDLPELPEGWVWASLGQCFKVEVGATPSRKQPTYWGGEIPWASSGEVQFGRIKETKEKITEDGLKNSSTQINPKGSVLLGMIGEGKTRGQSAILDIDAANNQNCAALWVPNSRISSEYVFYWLWSQYDKTRSGSSGNNQPALNKSLVEKMPIAISSIKEMAFIGSYLSEEFTSVGKKTSDISFALKQSAAQRKNILKSAFSGQLVPQDPNDEPASVLLEKIKLEREALAKKPKTKQIKTKSAMKKITVEELAKWVDNYKGNSFTFEELQTAFQGDYDQLKDCVFDMLSADKPLFKQLFNQKLNAITFIKEGK